MAGGTRVPRSSVRSAMACLDAKVVAHVVERRWRQDARRAAFHRLEQVAGAVAARAARLGRQRADAGGHPHADADRPVARAGPHARGRPLPPPELSPLAPPAARLPAPVGWPGA